MKDNKKNNKIKNLLSNQKGMALLTTLIFVFILVTFGVALLTMTSNDTKLSTLQRDSTKAFYFAESGIEQALYNLNIDENYESLSWRPGFSVEFPSPFSPYDTSTAAEYYEITIQNKGTNDPDANPPQNETDKIEIISTGVVKGDGKKVSGKRIIKVIADIFFSSEAKYKYAILSDKVMLFQGVPGPRISSLDEENPYPPIHSNDSMEVNGPFTYEGEASASGDRNDLDGDNIYAQVEPIPEIDFETLLNTPDGGNVGVDGRGIPIVVHRHSEINLGNGEFWGEEGDPITGIHFVDGDIIAKNGAEIWIHNGAIIATGKIDLREGSLISHTRDDGPAPEPYYINPDNPFTAYAVAAKGDIIFHAKSSSLHGLVQSEGSVEFHNESTVIGAVIAETVWLHNKTNIIYDGENLSQFTTQGDAIYRKISWQEAYN